MKIPSLNLWYALSLRIILLFVTAMLVSFVPDYLRNFFGDVKYLETEIYHHSLIDDQYEWGFRHSLYFFMCCCLFIVQAIRLGMWVDKNHKEFKP